MSQLSRSIADWLRAVWAGWNRFWFTPADPATYCLIRVLAGAMLLYTHLVWTLRLEEFLGPDSFFALGARESIRASVWRWSHFRWFDSPLWLWGTHLAALGTLVLLTIGLWTRAAAVLAFLFTVSYIHQAAGAVFGLDQINVMLALYLVVGPAGACYSVDAWLARRRGQGPKASDSILANIAIRLMQLHMCVIYLFAGLSKLRGPAWWDGSAMWMAFANFEYQSWDMTWMADWPQLVSFLTHVTVAWEISYFALVWPRLSRPVVLLLAVPLHLGIGLCLGMMTFGLAMLIGNLAFVPPGMVRRVLSPSLAAAESDGLADDPIGAAAPKHRLPADRETAGKQARAAAKARRA